MKIGITERGDAGLDRSWYWKLDEVDGAILITKKITNEFIQVVLRAYKSGYKIIVHCTCTGWGGSLLEPKVWDYKTQLRQLKKLIDAGFPAKNCVLRIDPIFPSEKGLERVKEMLDWYQIEILPSMEGIRYRMSVYDEYRHVKERLKSVGLKPLYDELKFRDYLGETAKVLIRYPFTFETCAEDQLIQRFPHIFVQKGCVSHDDLEIMNLPKEQFSTNGQNRKGCHCLTCKTELLTSKHRCPNQCIYCYWHD